MQWISGWATENLVKRRKVFSATVVGVVLLWSVGKETGGGYGGLGDLHGQPQCRRKTMMVGLGWVRKRLDDGGALSPILGTGATSLWGGVLKELSSRETA